MRRVLALIMTMAMIISLASCGGKKKSEEAKAVDEKIQAIGVVNLDSEQKIIEAEEEYSKLSDKDRNQLEYYQTLVDARTQYNTLVEQEKANAEQKVKDQIDEANKAIDDLDMKKAYELAISLPEEYKDEADRIIKKVDSLCYKDTFLVKLENATSSLPKSTDEPARALYGGITFGHEYSNFDTMQAALKDYHSYLSKYYIQIGNDGESYNEYQMSAQTYEFEDENGHKITVAGSDIMGFVILNISIEENVNYRDVVKPAE